METQVRKYKTCEFNILEGLTLTEIKKVGVEELHFIEESGRVFKMFHPQECCESVSLEDIVGDFDDIIGSPVLNAYESTSNKYNSNDYDRTCMWTFYHISTIKGTVTLRWYGTSNGYYSTSVDFVECL